MINIIYVICLILQWVPEITKGSPKTPFFLIGTQPHLREDEITTKMLLKQNQVSISQCTASQVAKEVKAIKYIESCLQSPECLAEVFDEFILESWKLAKPSTKWKPFLHLKAIFPISKSKFVCFSKFTLV